MLMKKDYKYLDIAYSPFLYYWINIYLKIIYASSLYII